MKNYLYIVTGANDPIDGDSLEFLNKQDAYDYSKGQAGSEIHLVGMENGQKVFDEVIFSSDAEPIKSDAEHNSCYDKDCPLGSEMHPYDIEEYLDDEDDVEQPQPENVGDLYQSDEDKDKNLLGESMKESGGFRVGDLIHITRMEGEPHYTGKEGTVESIDDIGQLHGTWGSLALIPGTDIFDKVEPSQQSTSDESVESTEESYVDRHNQEESSTENAEVYTEPSKEIPVEQCTKVNSITHTEDELQALEDQEEILKDLAPEEKYDIAEDLNEDVESDIQEFSDKVDSFFSKLDLTEESLDESADVEEVEDEDDYVFDEEFDEFDEDDIDNAEFVEELFSELAKRRDESK